MKPASPPLLDAVLGPLWPEPPPPARDAAAGLASPAPNAATGQSAGASRVRRRRRVSSASSAAAASARLHPARCSAADAEAPDIRVASQHEFTERRWARHRQQTAAALHRAPGDLVFSRSEQWREAQAKLELLGLLSSAERDTDASVAVETWAASLRNPLRDPRFRAVPPAAGGLASAPAATAAAFSPVRYVRIGGPSSPLFAPLPDPAARRARVFGGMSRGELQALRVQLLADLRLSDGCGSETQPGAESAANGDGGGGSTAALRAPSAFPSLAASYAAGAAAVSAGAHLSAAGHRAVAAAMPRAEPWRGIAEVHALLRGEYTAYREGARPRTTTTATSAAAARVRAHSEAAVQRCLGGGLDGAATLSHVPASCGAGLDGSGGGGAQQPQPQPQPPAAVEPLTWACSDPPAMPGLGEAAVDVSGAARSPPGATAAVTAAALTMEVAVQRQAWLAAASYPHGAAAPLAAAAGGTTCVHVQLLRDAALAAGCIGPAWADGWRLPGLVARGPQQPLLPSFTTEGGSSVSPWPLVVVPDAAGRQQGSDSVPAGSPVTTPAAVVRIANTGSTLVYVRVESQRRDVGCGAGRRAFTASADSLLILPGLWADLELRCDSSKLPQGEGGGFHSETWLLRTQPALSSGLVPALGLRAFVAPSLPTAAAGASSLAARRLEARLALAQARADEAEGVRLAAARACAAAASEAARLQRRARRFTRSNPGLVFTQCAWEALACVARAALQRGGVSDGDGPAPRDDDAVSEVSWRDSVRRLQALVDALPVPPDCSSSSVPPDVGAPQPATAASPTPTHDPAPLAARGSAVVVGAPQRSQRAAAPTAAAAAAAVTAVAPKATTGSTRGGAAQQAHPAGLPSSTQPAVASQQAAPPPQVPPSPPAPPPEEPLSKRDAAIRWKQDASCEIARVVVDCARDCSASDSSSSTGVLQRQRSSSCHLLGIVDIRLDGRIVLLDSELATLPAPLLAAAATAVGHARPTTLDGDSTQLPLQALLSTRQAQNMLPSLRNALACGTTAIVVPLQLQVPPACAARRDDEDGACAAAPWSGLAAAVSVELGTAHALVLADAAQLAHASLFIGGECPVAASGGEQQGQQAGRYAALLDAATAGAAGDLTRFVRGLAEGCRRARLPAPVLLLLLAAQQPPAPQPQPQQLRGDPRSWRPWELALWLRRLSVYVGPSDSHSTDPLPVNAHHPQHDHADALPRPPPLLLQSAVDAVVATGMNGSVLSALAQERDCAADVAHPLGLADPVLQSAVAQAAARLLQQSSQASAAALSIAAVSRGEVDEPGGGGVEAGDRHQRAAGSAVFAQAARHAALCNSVDVVATDRFVALLHPPFILSRARALALRAHKPPPPAAFGAGGAAHAQSAMTSAASVWSLRDEHALLRSAASRADDPAAHPRSHTAAVVMGCLIRAFLARRRVAHRRREHAACLAALCGPTSPAQWAGLQRAGLEAFGLPRPLRDRHRHLCRLPAKLPAWGGVVCGMSLLPQHVAAAAQALGARLSRVPAAMSSSGGSSSAACPRILAIVGGGGGGRGSRGGGLAAACRRLGAYLQVAETVVLVGALGAAWVSSVTLPRVFQARRAFAASSEPPQVPHAQPASAAATAAVVVPATKKQQPAVAPSATKVAGAAAAMLLLPATASPGSGTTAPAASTPASLRGLRRSVLGRTAEQWLDDEWEACGDALRELAHVASVRRVRVVAPLDFVMGEPFQAAAAGQQQPRWRPVAPAAIVAEPLTHPQPPKVAAMRTLFEAADAAAAASDSSVTPDATTALFTWTRASSGEVALGSPLLPATISVVPASCGAPLQADAAGSRATASLVESTGVASKAAVTAAAAAAAVAAPTAAATAAAPATSKVAAGTAGSRAFSKQPPAVVAAEQQPPPTSAKQPAAADELFVLDVGPRTVESIQRVTSEFVAAAAAPPVSGAPAASHGFIICHGSAGVVELAGGQAGTRAVLAAVAAGGRREGTGTALLGGSLSSFVFARAMELVADGLTSLSFDVVAGGVAEACIC